MGDAEVSSNGRSRLRTKLTDLHQRWKDRNDSKQNHYNSEQSQRDYSTHTYQNVQKSYDYIEAKVDKTTVLTAASGAAMGFWMGGPAGAAIGGIAGAAAPTLYSWWYGK